MKESRGLSPGHHQANLNMPSPMSKDSFGETYQSASPGDLLKIETLRMKEAGETKAQILRREANN